jgi:hypothetical protein
MNGALIALSIEQNALELDQAETKKMNNKFSYMYLCVALYTNSQHSFKEKRKRKKRVLYLVCSYCLTNWSSFQSSQGKVGMGGGTILIVYYIIFNLTMCGAEIVTA